MRGESPASDVGTVVDRAVFSGEKLMFHIAVLRRFASRCPWCGNRQDEVVAMFRAGQIKPEMKRFAMTDALEDYVGSKPASCQVARS